MADRLLALAAVLDGLDRRPRIRMRHAPHPSAQRLLDSLGVLVFIDLSAPRCVQRCNQKECRMSTVATFEPNWISYRHSVLQASNRSDAEDETLEICVYCECEIDVIPAPHRPGCRGIGGPRASSATVASPPMVAKPAAVKEPAPPATDPEDLDDDELELDEEADGPPEASSSSPVLEEEGVAAVGDLTGSGSTDGSSSEPERAATTSNPANPYRLQKMGRGYIWTKDTALQSVRDFAATNGHPPSRRHLRDLPAGTLPGTGSATDLFGSWADLIEQAGFARPTKGTNYPETRTAARAADKRPAAAAAPLEPEPRDTHERDARAVDASPMEAQRSAPSSGPGGANPEPREAPPGEIRLLALALIAAARAFAATLEHELERSDAA